MGVQGLQHPKTVHREAARWMVRGGQTVAASGVRKGCGQPRRAWPDACRGTPNPWRPLRDWMGGVHVGPHSVELWGKRDAGGDRSTDSGPCSGQCVANSRQAVATPVGSKTAGHGHRSRPGTLNPPMFGSACDHTCQPSEAPPLGPSVSHTGTIVERSFSPCRLCHSDKQTQHTTEPHIGKIGFTIKEVVPAANKEWSQ